MISPDTFVAFFKAVSRFLGDDDAWNKLFQLLIENAGKFSEATDALRPVVRDSLQEELERVTKMIEEQSPPVDPLAEAHQSPRRRLLDIADVVMGSLNDVLGDLPGWLRAAIKVAREWTKIT